MPPFSTSAILLWSLTGAQASAAVAPPPQATESAVEAAPAPQAEPEKPAARRVDLLFEGALVGARDGQDFAETPGYRRLLESLGSYSDDELHARVQRTLDIQAALAAPDEWRGEFVRLRAQVGGRWAQRLATPLRGSIDVFRASLTDGEDGVIVDFLEEPPDVRRADVVDVEGVFFRTVRFENERGEFKEAPYLLARKLTRPDDASLPRRTVVDSLVGWAALLAGGLFLAIRIGMVVRSASQRKRDRDVSRASRTLREHAMAPLRASKQRPTTPHSSP